jgi:hypothetical protein
LAARIFVLIKFPLILLQEHLQSYKRPQDIWAITIFAMYLGNGGCPFCFFSSCDLWVCSSFHAHSMSSPSKGCECNLMHWLLWKCENSKLASIRMRGFSHIFWWSLVSFANHKIAYPPTTVSWILGWTLENGTILWPTQVTEKFFCACVCWHLHYFVIWCHGMPLNNPKQCNMSAKRFFGLTVLFKYHPHAVYGPRDAGS